MSGNTGSRLHRDFSVGALSRRPQAFFSGVYTVPPFPGLEGEAFLQSPSNEVLLSQRLSTMFSSVCPARSRQLEAVGL